METPLDWEQMLAYLKMRAIPGVETIDGHHYRRSFVWGPSRGCFSVNPVPMADCLRLKVVCQTPAHLKGITRRVGRIFDLKAPVKAIRRRLGKDPLLSETLEHSPLPRVPGTWDGFELAIRAIVGQQVSVKGATTVAGRLVQNFGRRLPSALADNEAGLTHLFPSPKALAHAPVEKMSMPLTRAMTIQGLAQAVLDKKLAIDPAADPDRTVQQLKEIKGIGDWTAQYIAMRALRQPDAFPAADLGLIKAASGKERRLTPAQLEARAEAWRPFRAYAAVLLWTGPN